MSSKETYTLSSGETIPKVGFGTWQAAPGEVGQAVVEAVKAGYRHLDLALIYENQTEIRKALNEVIPSVVQRDQLFITSKCWNSSHKPEEVQNELTQTLSELGLDYLDLYLIHWPVAFAPRIDPKKEAKPGYHQLQLYPPQPGNDDEVELDLETSLVDTWEAMTKLSKDQVKHVGVSNFTIEHLEGITAKGRPVPVVNQIEAHPRLLQDDLKKYCDEKKIHITAYSPLGNNSIGEALLTENDVVTKIAGEKQATPAQVLIAWAVKRGYSVIPKSVNPDRIKSNFQQVGLSDDEYGRLNALGDKPMRYNIPYRYKPKWDISLFDDKAEKEAKHKVKIE
ncbi:NADP-dependent oxidoreductase domain-containing protein [Mycena vitilis]|nr:NADP-dependent oxidoreductase domain-containing protein [Mycena vitilis]